MSKKDKNRALAHIEKIEWIKDIDGADNIVLAGVLGWEVICKRNEFKVGEKCVYIEIDSLCPAKDERFEFLANKKFKVKTMKLNKFNVFSQGLALPVTMFPEVAGKDIGTDVTKDLNITYYSEEDRNRKSNKSKQDSKYNSMFSRMKSKHPKFFKSKLNKYLMKKKWGKKLLFVFFGKKKDKPLSMPNFIKRTDELRVENLPQILEGDEEWVVTEKLDGCFDPYSKIKTKDGDIEISKIVNQKMNVEVLSYNEELKVCEYKPVIGYKKIEINDKPIYKLTVSHRGHGNRNKYLTCTGNHLFLTNNGWKRADELNINDKLQHYSLSFHTVLKQILLGCIIGDSCIVKKDGKYTGSIQFSHSIKQIDYFNYKKNIFGNGFIQSKSRISGYNSEILRGCLISTHCIYNFIQEYCINNNIKYIGEKWANSMTPISWAFLYMDDGSIENRDNPNIKCKLNIALNAYTYEEVLNLKKSLFNKYNINSEIRTKKSYKGNVLALNTEDSEKFFSLIAPYICDSMKYKLPIEYQNLPCVFDNITFNMYDNIVETNIKEIEKIEDNSKLPYNYMYDIQVEDNHNYFVKNILVHNCSGTFYICRKSSKSKHFEFGVCSRNIRQKSPDQVDYHMQTSGAKTNSYWDIAFKYNIEDILRNYATRNGVKTLVLQGEIIGENIQKNPYKIKGIDFYAFNLYIDGERIGTEELELFCKEYHLNCVPIVDYRHKLPKTMEEMKLEADGFSRLNNEVKREGFVYRSLDGKQSFKNVSREYLLKHS